MLASAQIIDYSIRKKWGFSVSMGPWKKRDPREKVMIDRLARGSTARGAAIAAGYSESYANSHASGKAKNLEELVDLRRAELLRSRADLVPEVQAIERSVIGRVSEKLAAGKDLDRVETELASKTIARVDRAVRIEDDIQTQNLVQVAIQIGQLIREQVNFSSEAVPVEVPGNEADRPPAAT
ncbi:MAG: hypothetical protein KJ621_16655 [Proteobacteria bacterium]|nr:hypothetical protein [Pseudomonadota bacterium]